MVSNSKRKSGSSVSIESRASRPIKSVRLGDIEGLEKRAAQEARAERAQKKRRKTLIIIIGVLACVALAIVSFISIYNSSAFEIKNMEVKGADHLTYNEVSHMISIPQGTTLLNVDTDALARSLERDAWVKSVQFNRLFPSTLEVVVTERKIGAIVEVPMGTSLVIEKWALSEDGKWLMAIPDKESDIGKGISPKIYEDADVAMHITEIPIGFTPQIGEQCTNQSILSALDIVKGMTTELADQVANVSITDTDSTMITLKNGVEIAFGSPNNVREKERICLEILKKNPGKVTYINVRVPDRPTYRTV